MSSSTEYNYLYRLIHADEIKEKAKLYREQRKIYNREYRANKAPKYLESLADRAKLRSALKEQLLDRLGPRCTRCGFSDVRILQFDHILGGGTEDKRKNPNVERKYQMWLADLNLEMKIQVLCPNCNWLKRVEQKECFCYGY